MNNAVIIGASSGIGRKLAEHLAFKGFNLIICSRNIRDLDAIANDLRNKFKTEVRVKACDISNSNDLNSLFNFCISNSDLDYVFITVGQVFEDDDGLLGNTEIDTLVRTNYLSVIQLISSFVNVFLQKDKGQLVTFSSIAASAPRKKNVIYASAKAALEVYCRGLQHLLSNSDIKIQVYRLGYVDTPMSFGKKSLLPVADPEKIAKKIVKNLNKNIRIQYMPKFWFFIILILKILPWNIYKRLSF